MKPTIPVLAIALGACSLAPGGGQVESAVAAAIDAGLADRQAYNDRKADLLPRLACDISIGAYARLGESDVKRGVALICGLDRGAAVAADLEAAAGILDALSRLDGQATSP